MYKRHSTHTHTPPPQRAMLMLDSLPLSPEMQIFTRDVRRILRNGRTRIMMMGREGSTTTTALSKLVSIIAKVYIIKQGNNNNNPRFLMRNLRRTAEKLLRSLDEGTHGSSSRFLLNFNDLIMHTGVMLTGTFHGRRCPDTAHRECSICLSRGSGSWWRRSSCGHCFHVQCINTHFKYNTRCPLCRGAV